MCRTSFYDPLEFCPKKEPLYALDPKDVADFLYSSFFTFPLLGVEEITLQPQKHGIEKKRPFS